jgi:dolichol-phosphate mannosyltransferase
VQSIVVTPTYNESENIAEFVRRVRQSVPGLHILIVDDNSPDGTGDIGDGLAREHPGEVFMLHRERKLGLGRAYVAGFGHVLEKGYDIVVQMDADLSHDPSSLPVMLERIQHCDLVLGSRYMHGIAVVNWDFKRLMLSRMATRYVRLITGMRCTDATGGFKCWRRRTLEAIDLDDVFSNGYVFQVEMTYKAFQKGFRVAEVPIVFYERNLGKSKMDSRIILEALWGVWKLRFKNLQRGRS